MLELTTANQAWCDDPTASHGVQNGEGRDNRAIRFRRHRGADIAGA
jgi:hypothetical protein